MSDLQLYLAIGIPMLAVLASLVVSLVQVSGIRAEMLGIRAEMQSVPAEIQSIREDMRLQNKSHGDDMRLQNTAHSDDMREIRASLATLTSVVYERMGIKG